MSRSLLRVKERRCSPRAGRRRQRACPSSWQAAMTKDRLSNPIVRGQRLIGLFAKFRFFNGERKFERETNSARPMDAEFIIVDADDDRLSPFDQIVVLIKACCKNQRNRLDW